MGRENGGFIIGFASAFFIYKDHLQLSVKIWC
jgi:hypothetical protein